MPHSGVCVVSSARLECSVFLRTDEELGVNASLLRVVRKRDREMVLMFIVVLRDYNSLRVAVFELSSFEPRRLDRS